MQNKYLAGAISLALASMFLVGCDKGPVIQTGPVAIVSPYSAEDELVARDADEVVAEDALAAPATFEPAKAVIDVFEPIKQKAEAGDSDARFQLGMMYLLGEGGAPKDRSMAKEWLMAAAEAGHSMAISNLGSLMLNSEYGTRDEALEIFERGVQAGDLDAMRHAAFLLAYQEDGLTLVQDQERLAKARRYLEEAASKGDLYAEASMGVLLADLGEIKEAVKVLKRPMEKGMERAIFRLADIAQKDPSAVDAKTQSDVQRMIAKIEGRPDA